jgi:hypothetical protein
MKWRSLTILFVAVLPIYGQQESSKPTPQENRPQNAKKPDAKQGSAQPNAAAVINQTTTNTEHESSKSNSKSYLSRLFSPENLPNIGLFFAGLLGIWVATRTLKAIESQTSVLSESQRPRLVAEAGEHPAKTLFEDPETPRVVLEVINKGPMPATGYIYESWIEVLPDTSGDFTVHADHHRSEVISVMYPSAPRKFNIPLREGISDQDWPLVRKLKKHVCVRLYVEWADPFIPNRRCYADFGFHVLPDGMGFLSKHNGVGYIVSAIPRPS